MSGGFKGLKGFLTRERRMCLHVDVAITMISYQVDRIFLLYFAYLFFILLLLFQFRPILTGISSA